MVFTINIKEQKIQNWSAPVIKLEDKPRLTASELKSCFDSNSNQLKDTLNTVIDILSGEMGAENIGIHSITGYNSKNVQQGLEDLADTISKVDPYLGNPVDISQGGTGKKDSQNALYNLGAKPNNNLLDNWYFIGSNGNFPINQRGKTGQNAYNTAGYCIDRWNILSTYVGNISVLNDGLYVEKTETNDCIIEQYLHQNLTGEKLTFSALVDDKLYSMTKIVDNLDYTNAIQMPNNNTIRLFSSGGKTIIRFWVQTGKIKISAVKLEFGDKQTLARQLENGSWELLEKPDYATELTKCQRYFYPLPNSESFFTSAITGYGDKAFVIFPIQMASTGVAPKIITDKGLIPDYPNSGMQIWTYDEVTNLQSCYYSAVKSGVICIAFNLVGYAKLHAPALFTNFLNDTYFISVEV